MISNVPQLVSRNAQLKSCCVNVVLE